MRHSSGCDELKRPCSGLVATLPPAQPTRPWRYNSGFSGPVRRGRPLSAWLPGVVKPATRASSVDPRGARRFTSSKDSMSLQCGIVGLPNVGKSTLFNALTKAGIAAENYPFCTIEPNVGVVEVPDPRLAAHGESSRLSAWFRPLLNSSISRALSPVRARAKAWATSSSRTFAKPMPSRTWCAASKTKT